MGIDYRRILKQFEDVHPGWLDDAERLRLENAYLRQLVETQKDESLRLKRLLRTNFHEWSA